MACTLRNETSLLAEKVRNMERVKVRKGQDPKVRTTKVHQSKPEYEPSIEEGMDELSWDDDVIDDAISQEDWADYEQWLDGLEREEY